MQHVWHQPFLRRKLTNIDHRGAPLLFGQATSIFDSIYTYYPLSYRHRLKMCQLIPTAHIFAMIHFDKMWIPSLKSGLENDAALEIGNTVNGHLLEGLEELQEISIWHGSSILGTGMVLMQPTEEGSIFKQQYLRTMGTWPFTSQTTYGCVYPSSTNIPSKLILLMLAPVKFQVVNSKAWSWPTQNY